MGIDLHWDVRGADQTGGNGPLSVAAVPEYVSGSPWAHMHTTAGGRIRAAEAVTATPAEVSTGAMTVNERIIKDPKVMRGVPVFKGTRIPAWLVIGYLAHADKPGDVYDEFPELSRDDVSAALDYASKLLSVPMTRSTIS